MNTTDDYHNFQKFNSYEHKYFSIVDYIFMVIFLIKLIKGNHSGLYNRKNLKWTNTFTLKFLSSIFISILYSAYPIMLYHALKGWVFFFFLNALCWLLSSSQLYFEYRRKKPQSWLGLRSFWLLNGLLSYARVGFFIYIIDDKTKTHYAYIKFLIILSILKTVLLYLSIFKNKDHGYVVDLHKKFLERDSLSNIDLKVEHKTSVDKRKKSEYFEDLKNLNVSKNNLKLQIELSETKIRKFSLNTETNGEELKNTFSSQNELISSIKFDISLFVNLIDYQSRENKYDYFKKKSVSSIIEFNKNIIAIFNSKYKSLNSLLLELNNLNYMLINNEKNTNYSSTFTSNFNLPAQSSFATNPNKPKANTINLDKLTKTYNILAKKYYFFIVELFKFLEISNPILSNVVSSPENITNYDNKFNSNLISKKKFSSKLVLDKNIIKESVSIENLEGTPKNSDLVVKVSDSRVSITNSSRVNNSETDNTNVYISNLEKEEYNQIISDTSKISMFVIGILTNINKPKVNLISIVYNFDNQLIFNYTIEYSLESKHSFKYLSNYFNFTSYMFHLKKIVETKDMRNFEKGNFDTYDYTRKKLKYFTEVYNSLISVDPKQLKDKENLTLGAKLLQTFFQDLFLLDNYSIHHLKLDKMILVNDYNFDSLTILNTLQFIENKKYSSSNYYYFLFSSLKDILIKKTSLTISDFRIKFKVNNKISHNVSSSSSNSINDINDKFDNYKYSYELHILVDKEPIKEIKIKYSLNKLIECLKELKLINKDEKILGLVNSIYITIELILEELSYANSENFDLKHKIIENSNNESPSIYDIKLSNNKSSLQIKNKLNSEMNLNNNTLNQLNLILENKITALYNNLQCHVFFSKLIRQTFAFSTIIKHVSIYNSENQDNIKNYYFYNESSNDSRSDSSEYSKLRGNSLSNSSIIFNSLDN